MPVSDAVISQNKGNLQGLYDAWVKPLNDSRHNWIPIVKETQYDDAEENIANGMTRFCTASGGKLRTTPYSFGNNFYCTDVDGGLIGQLTTMRTAIGKNSYLVIEVNSDAKSAEENQKYWAERKRNAPSGWITTTEGKYRFLRFGNLEQGPQTEIELTEAIGFQHRRLPLTSVRRIQFDERCCQGEVTSKDGQIARFTLLLDRIAQSQSTSLQTLGFVVVDPESGEPYAKIFPDQTKIRSIEIDPNENEWKYKRDEKIPSGFQPLTSAKLTRYKEKLTAEAASLERQAARRGLDRQLFPGGHLVDGVDRNLKSYLHIQSLSTNPDCTANVRTGIKNLEKILECQIAQQEYHLVVESGYPLSVKNTPLSLRYVYARVLRDLH